MTESAFRLEDDFYKPVSPAEPCGANMQREEAFFDLRSLATPKPGRYDPINNRDLPPTPPEWNRVLPAARDLLKKTRDCSVFITLAKAELAEGGLTAYAGALDCLLWHLKTFWEDMHPQGDEDDDYWERVAALRTLGDANSFAKPLETAPLHISRMAGPVTLRTLQIASGAATAKEGELALTESALEQLIAEENVGPKFSEAHDAAEKAKATLEEICSFVSGQPGSEHLAAKEPIEALDKVRSLLEPFLDQPVEAAPAPEAEAEEAGEEVVETVVRRPAAGDLKTREEAVALMRAVIAHYAGAGRSSPVPLVMARLMELMDTSFSEVLEQIAPGSWEEASLPLAGLRADRLGAAPPAAAPAANAPDSAAMDAAARRLDAATGSIEQTLRDGYIPSTEQTGELRAATEALIAASRVREAAPEAPKPPEIAGPADVRSAIDRLVKHFEATDPNSVVPAFLRRAKPLVDRHFPDILKELAPDGAGGAQLALYPDQPRRNLPDAPPPPAPQQAGAGGGQAAPVSPPGARKKVLKPPVPPSPNA